MKTISHKSIILLLLLLFSYTSFFSQQSQDSMQVTDPVSKPPKPPKTQLTDDEYAKVLNIQFSNIVSGQSNNSLGNFASINIEDSSLEFAPTIITKGGRLFVTEFKAGVSDGISSVFSNSKLNTNISLKANYHFIGPSKSSKVGVKNLHIKK